MYPRGYILSIDPDLSGKIHFLNPALFKGKARFNLQSLDLYPHLNRANPIDFLTMSAN